MDQVAARMQAQADGSRWYVLFPLGGEKNTDALRDKLFDLRKRGFNRLYQAARYSSSQPRSLCSSSISQSPCSSCVDRLAITPDIRQRLVDAVEISLSRIRRSALWSPRAGGQTLPVQRKVLPQAVREKRFHRAEPSLFSFNSPFGACRHAAKVLGNTIDYDLDLVIPNRALKL